MEGPRGGLMAGDKDMMDKIKSKAFQYGLEAQPPVIAGMVRALEKFKPENLLKARDRKNNLHKLLKREFHKIEETPTGIMLSPTALKNELEGRNIHSPITDHETAILFAMILLREHNILTIPAVGMPGASSTIRLDMAAQDANRIDDEFIKHSLISTMDSIKDIDGNENTMHRILFE
jgi:L-seryl-tRNA(Ser) seleniumtransferase